jgi:hypothetical protein
MDDSQEMNDSLSLALLRQSANDWIMSRNIHNKLTSSALLKTNKSGTFDAAELDIICQFIECDDITAFIENVKYVRLPTIYDQLIPYIIKYDAIQFTEYFIINTKYFTRYKLPILFIDYITKSIKDNRFSNKDVYFVPCIIKFIDCEYIIQALCNLNYDSTLLYYLFNMYAPNRSTYDKFEPYIKPIETLLMFYPDITLQMLCDINPNGYYYCELSTFYDLIIKDDNNINMSFAMKLFAYIMEDLQKADITILNNILFAVNYSCDYVWIIIERSILNQIPECFDTFCKYINSDMEEKIAAILFVFSWDHLLNYYAGQKIHISDINQLKYNIDIYEELSYNIMPTIYNFMMYNILSLHDISIDLIIEKIIIRAIRNNITGYESIIDYIVTYGDNYLYQLLTELFNASYSNDNIKIYIISKYNIPNAVIVPLVDQCPHISPPLIELLLNKKYIFITPRIVNDDGIRRSEC